MKTCKTILICLLLFSPFLAKTQTTRDKFKDFRIVVNDVSFAVDPRIELYHTIEVLSGFPLVNYVELDYKEKMENSFADFKTHPLFAFFNRNYYQGKLFRSIDAPIFFLIHLTNDFEWRKDAPYSDAQNPYLDSLRILMKDFSAKANYPKFFNSNAGLYNISLSTLVYNLPEFDEKNRLLNYCGEKNAEHFQFRVILNFLGWGNFGPRIFKNDGAELYAVIAPGKTAIRVPTFDVADLYKLLWHEFAHSFANPAVEKVESQFDQYSYLWEPVKAPMAAQAYHSWQSVIKEHLTEAIACRMAAQKFGEDAAELNYVRFQKGKNWLYLSPLLKALKYYEANRRTYPTLSSFMPKILESLKEIKPADIDAWKKDAEQIRKPDVKAIPAIGDIYDRKNILFILASAEQDKAADQKLKEFIDKMKNRIPSLKDAKVVDDTTALKMDLSSYNLSVWGTPRGNKFLQQYISQIPLLVKDDRIIAENTYNGTGYGVLMAWVNPFNNDNMMAVYTAQNPANLVDFNKIMNGGGNYHIFRNYITLKQGNFSRLGSVWLAK